MGRIRIIWRVGVNKIKKIKTFPTHQLSPISKKKIINVEEKKTETNTRRERKMREMRKIL